MPVIAGQAERQSERQWEKLAPRGKRRRISEGTKRQLRRAKKTRKRRGTRAAVYSDIINSILPLFARARQI